jgi:hypothetical protein
MMTSGPEIMFGIGALLLGLAMAYGVLRYRSRSRLDDRKAERGAAVVYDDADRRDPER